MSPGSGDIHVMNFLNILSKIVILSVCVCARVYKPLLSCLTLTNGSESSSWDCFPLQSFPFCMHKEGQKKKKTTWKQLKGFKNYLFLLQ